MLTSRSGKLILAGNRIARSVRSGIRARCIPQISEFLNRSCYALLPGLGLILLPLGGQPVQADETRPGFEARIEGAYEGQVSGAGVLVFVANVGANKQGYYFLADGRGIRPHGVTITLPLGLATGRHELTSPSPFDLGAVPSVRVDRDTGDATVSSQTNTSGHITLNAFPADKAALSGSKVQGEFEFRTENRDGQSIEVKGAFSFQVR